MARKSRYLTYTDRLIIERLVKKGATGRAIAVFLEVSPATISRELKRGRCDLITSDLIPYISYSADKAQQDADYQNTAKGKPLKIGNDHALAAYIESEILAGKSPDVVISTLSKKGKRPFSTVTLYRYIDRGVFLHITNSNLIEKSRRRRKYNHIKKAARAPKGTSIEFRPSCIDTREEFGHWEMDCVIGKAKGKRQALLVLTERKTRFEIITHLRNKNARSVVHALDKLQQQYNFPSLFKTITVDNGCEFSDCVGMEYDRGGNRRTTCYYCHPYTSCERGSNERMNRMIRRFFPKGQSMYSVTNAQCQAAADWLNNYPRKLLGYETPAALFAAEFSAL